MRQLIVTIGVLALFASPLSADIIHDESVNGDLSGAFGAPTVLSFIEGDNTIIGQIGNNGNTGATNGQDADYFTFNVGAGLNVNSIFIDSYTFSPNDPGVSFIGYVAGTSFGGQGGGDIDGSDLFNATSGNILNAADLGTSSLGPGDYSIWIQETSPNIVDYQITFTVVPEPSATGAALLGLFLLRRKRTARTNK